MKWWLSTGEATEGPFPREHIEQWLRSGQIAPATMACSEGGSDWRPLNEIQEFAGLVGTPQGTPPPPPPPPSTRSAPAPPLESPTGGSRGTFGVLTAAIVLGALALFLDLVFIGDTGEDLGPGILLYLCVGIAAVITMAIFHYQLWQLLPAQFAETTPGKAVGFLFIPFFNCYWVFTSYVGVSRGLNAVADAHNLPPPRANTGVAVAASVFFIISWLFLLLALQLPSVENIANDYIIQSEQDLIAAYDDVANQHLGYGMIAFVFASAPSFVLWLLMVLAQKRMVGLLVKHGVQLNRSSGLLQA